MIEGAGELALRSYSGLHRKIAELLPDDFYITDSLKLEVQPGEANHEDARLLGQVQMVASQLIIYLEGLVKDSEGRRGWNEWAWGWGDQPGRPPVPPTPPGAPNPPNPPNPPGPPPDWRGLGRELQDQIINLTRSTIRRALSNIDVDVNVPNPMRGVNMQGETLTGRNFKQGRLFGANLGGVNGEGVEFEEARLAGVNFTDANLSRANFARTRVDGCIFDGTNLSDATLEGGVFVGCTFANANLTNAKLDGARFVNPNLRNTTLPDGTTYDDGDLRKFGATMITRRVHIDIGDDDDGGEAPGSGVGGGPEGDNKPKRDDLV